MSLNFFPPVKPLFTFPSATSSLLFRLMQALLLLLLHLLVQGLRRILAPGFPSTGELASLIPGVLLETVVTGLLLWLTLGYRFEPDRLFPRRLDRRLIEGVITGMAAGIAFFVALLLLDALFRLPEKEIVGVSYWRQGLLVPAVEEIYFRFLLTGVLLQRGWPLRWAIPLTAMIFALSHDYFVAPFLLPVGLAAGWLFARYGAWASFLMHATYNLLILVRALH